MTSGSEGLLTERGANWKRLEKGEVGAEGRGRAEAATGPQETLGEGMKMKKGRDKNNTDMI